MLMEMTVFCRLLLQRTADHIHGEIIYHCAVECLSDGHLHIG